MSAFVLRDLETAFDAIRVSERCGEVCGINSGAVTIRGVQRHACLGDQVRISGRSGVRLSGEIVALSDGAAQVMTYGPSDGLAIGDPAALSSAARVSPDDSWVGRIVDAFGNALEGPALHRGPSSITLRAAPPPAAERRQLGPRLSTGLAVFDTVLPIVRGQRIGIFSGSGVGKTSLIAQLGRHMAADVVVIALIGERGRELRHFTDQVLGPEGRARSVIVAATSDQSPLVKRRAAWTAMAVAEYFRDSGKQVLLLMDSITRFAESHREVALTAGEAPSLRAFPPSTSNMISGLTERAGPGVAGKGDITAIFTVLVAGADMEEPVADITRGLLDGHVILEREIAERGRFPAVDVRRSVSRSLPDAANDSENQKIQQVREVLGTYENAATMIRAGLYAPGADPELDRAVKVWPELDKFFAQPASSAFEETFGELGNILILGSETEPQ